MPSKTHGMSKTAIYKAWQGMKSRCYNPNATGYERWGGRGIRVCQRWLDSFENFRDDMLATWKPKLQLERVQNDSDYSPDNCVWATRSEQMKNRCGFHDEWRQNQSKAQKRSMQKYWANASKEIRRERSRAIKAGIAQKQAERC